MVHSKLVQQGARVLALGYKYLGNLSLREVKQPESSEQRTTYQLPLSLSFNLLLLLLAPQLEAAGRGVWPDLCRVHCDLLPP